jgi:hypothetical protein
MASYIENLGEMKPSGEGILSFQVKKPSCSDNCNQLVMPAARNYISCGKRHSYRQKKVA